MSLSAAIKAEAKRLGFDLVGVTSPEPPAHLEVFNRWLAAGRHGEMAYLATERSVLRRSDPREILPECRSILVLGARYASPRAGAEVEPESVRSAKFSGRIASYAWGDDYHEVLPERLQALISYIEGLAGHSVPNRWYTDTGPLMERELGQRAGLGWIGKNTCLIQPRLGSYYLLSEILLGIELESDTPISPDYCGTCTRCLEACPTACILPDRTLDARRCISYLTIELKGAIPPELRSETGEWVFGCDICQEVCPWNLRFAQADDRHMFGVRPDIPAPDLLEELAITVQGFNQKFKLSPVKRARRRGYLRNITLAIANQARHERQRQVAREALRKALIQDPEKLVRAHAAWALGRVGGQEARQDLEQALGGEGDDEVLSEIREALQGWNG